MDHTQSFLYGSIRNSGKQRFFDLSIVYILAALCIFVVCFVLSIKELLNGFASGWASIFAFVMALLSGLLSYRNIRYLLYGWRIYRHPETAQFLTLFEEDKPFEEICAEVEREKEQSLVEGLKNVTVTENYLYVRQKGYFELYRHSDIRSLSLQSGGGAVLSLIDAHGNHRELTRFWDDEAVPKLLGILNIPSLEEEPEER